MINGIVHDAKEQAKAAKKTGRGSRMVTMSGCTISGNSNLTINACGSINVNGMSIETSGPVSIVNGTVILPAGASCVISGSGSIRVATEGADLSASTLVTGGKASEKTIKITEPFTGITNESSIDVNYKQGDKVSVKARGSKSDLEKLDIQVFSSSLIIGFKSGTFTAGHVVVDVVAPSVTEFSNRGSGDTKIEGDLKDLPSCTFRTAASGDITANAVKADVVSVSTNGSGDVRIKKAEAKLIDIRINSSADVTLESVKASQVRASVAGSGEIRLAGTANEVDYSVTGSGDIAAGRLKATTGSAQLMGSGDITANVSGRFNSRCLGSGDIENVN